MMLLLGQALTYSICERILTYYMVLVLPQYLSHCSLDSCKINIRYDTQHPIRFTMSAIVTVSQHPLLRHYPSSQCSNSKLSQCLIYRFDSCPSNVHYAHVHSWTSTSAHRLLLPSQHRLHLIIFSTITSYHLSHHS